MKPTNMRAELLKRKNRKMDELMGMYTHQEEIAAQIRAAEAVVDELDSLLKLTPEEDKGSQTSIQPELRPNSAMAKVRDALRKLRKATHIDELIKAAGLPPEKKRSVTGQLSWYARREQIFSRPKPNTFGLLEWNDKSIKIKPDGSFVVGNFHSDTFAIGVPLGEIAENANGNKAKELESTEGEKVTALSLDDV